MHCFNFSYDASGNVISDGTRTLDYNGDDKLTHITKGSSTSTLRYVGETRYYQKDELVEGGQSVDYVYHNVGGFEKKTRTGGAGNLTEYRYTLADDIVLVERSDNTSDTYVLFKDHIGSVFTMLSTTGDVVSQQVFTPFGKKRTLYSQPLLSSATIMAPTEQGFTGHQQMDAFGIVHMKGRIYDPTIGRFLQADPHIQAPLNSQNYNRYSYVLNNPLSYTDPSGYFFKSLFKFVKKYWKTIVAIAASYVTFGLSTAAWSFSAIGNLSTGALIGGAAAGFVSGAIATGSLKGALKGG